MENNNNVFTLDKWKVENNIINTDNLKKILTDPHNNARLRDAVINEVKDLQSNINWLPINKQNEYLTKANDVFSKYSKNEKISSYKLIEEISKIAIEKKETATNPENLKKLVTKHETKKNTPTIPTDQNKNILSNTLSLFNKKNDAYNQAYAMLD